MESFESDELAHDFRPYFVVLKDGRVRRLFDTGAIPTCLNPQGVSSKDVAILPDLGVSARLYLPKLASCSNARQKIPILVYYHGGGFCFSSAFCGFYHNYLTSLVAEANVVAVSVDYRLAPEHPIPAAYDDAWAALQWVASHSTAAGPEHWLSEHGDFKRITIAGDSAGGNIVHNMAMRAGRDELGYGVKLRGAIVVHPFFTGVEPVGSEVANPAQKAVGDRIWMLLYPTTVGSDDPLINPMAVDGPSLSGLNCDRVLVCLAEKDVMTDRGRMYYERLRSSGWKGSAELLESRGEGHVFHLFDPTSENARIMIQRFVSFLI